MFIIAKCFVGGMVVLRLCVVFFDVALGVVDVCCIGILELTNVDLVFEVVLFIMDKCFVGGMVVLRLCVVFFDVALDVVDVCCIGILELTNDDLVFEVVVFIMDKCFVGGMVVLRLCVMFFDVAIDVVDEVDVVLSGVTVVSGMIGSMSGVVVVFIVVLSVGSVV